MYTGYMVMEHSDVDRLFSGVIEKGMSIDKGKRYQSAERINSVLSPNFL